MRALTLWNPVRLRFGRGTLDALHKEIPPTARVLVVYGGGSAERSGTLARVREQLALAEVEMVVEFGGIEANPRYEQLVEALPLIKQSQLNFVLGVGGGSVADGAKFIAAAACFDGDPWDLMLKKAAVRRALPIGAVMTLPATGSEMNAVTVVSRASEGLKIGLFSAHMYPQFSIVDPDLTATLPPKQIANGVVDAFVHILEAYLVVEQFAPIQTGFYETLLKQLLEYGPRTYADPEDKQARDVFCYAATWALNGLVGAGVVQDWSTHNIGHELTALYGIDHARSLAALLFDNLELRWDDKRARLARMAREVFGFEGADEEELARRALEATRRFFESFDVPTSLGAYPQVGEDAADLVLQKLKAHGVEAMGEGSAVTLELAHQIVSRSASRR